MYYVYKSVHIYFYILWKQEKISCHFYCSCYNKFIVLCLWHIFDCVVSNPPNFLCITQLYQLHYITYVHHHIYISPTYNAPFISILYINFSTVPIIIWYCICMIHIFVPFITLYCKCMYHICVTVGRR